MEESFKSTNAFLALWKQTEVKRKTFIFLKNKISRSLYSACFMVLFVRTDAWQRESKLDGKIRNFAKNYQYLTRGELCYEAISRTKVNEAINMSATILQNISLFLGSSAGCLIYSSIHTFKSWVALKSHSIKVYSLGFKTLTILKFSL